MEQTNEAIATSGPTRGPHSLAAVLWKGGTSFGGVVAFIFADLLILPILNVYRKYDGAWMAVLSWAPSTSRGSSPGTSWSSPSAGSA